MKMQSKAENRENAYGDGSFSPLVLPDGLVSIGREAFKSCERLESVTVPEGVTRIERGAFNGCISLKKVGLPKTLRVIEERAFAGCLSLRGIEIPEGVKTIERGAFSGCPLDGVVLPESIETVDLGCFWKSGSIELKGVPEKIYFKAYSENAFAVPVTAPRIPPAGVSDAFRACLMKGFFKDPGKYAGDAGKDAVRKEYVNVLTSEWEKYLPLVWEQDNAAVLAVYREAGVIDASNYESVFLKGAGDAGAASCTAWLLENRVGGTAFDDLLREFEDGLAQIP